MNFDICDGVIQGLVIKGIIYPAALGTVRHMDYNLKPWVINAIEKDKDLKNMLLEYFKEDIKIL